MISLLFGILGACILLSSLVHCKETKDESQPSSHQQLLPVTKLDAINQLLLIDEYLKELLEEEQRLLLNTAAAASSSDGPSSSSSSDSHTKRASYAAPYSGGIYGKRANLPFSGGVYGKRASLPFSGGVYGKRANLPYSGGLYGKRASLPFSGGVYGKRSENNNIISDLSAEESLFMDRGPVRSIRSMPINGGLYG